MVSGSLHIAFIHIHGFPQTKLRRGYDHCAKPGAVCVRVCVCVCVRACVCVCLRRAKAVVTLGIQRVGSGPITFEFLMP